MFQSRYLRVMCSAAILLLGVAPGAEATWSIVIADTETREVAVGTVTCLNNYDLLALVPVVVVGKGAGAVQSAGDFNGIRRPVIFNHLRIGTHPEDILQILSTISGHQQRQYGIADVNGGTVTFSGLQNGIWAGGMTGSQGTMVYAVQGNVLAGECVVMAIEQALLDTDGDIPAKLMAGMEAARLMGGDGRCSCLPSDPTACDCPVPSFTKAGHIGGMIVARLGDADDPVCNSAGCTDGDYFMKLNVANQTNNRPDPVFQLQEQYDAWRADLAGRPDAIQSLLELVPNPNPPPEKVETTAIITPLDMNGDLISVPIQSVTISHAPDSGGSSTFGAAVDNGDGTFSVVITGCESDDGVDVLFVTMDDGIRPVVLMPAPSIEYVGDVAPPTPNPLAWEVPPTPISTSELIMTAAEADDETLPVEYFFLYWPGPGSGGNTRFYDPTRTYVDTGLDTNMIYTYSVRARDSACRRNFGLNSAPGTGTTAIETPTGITIDAVTDTSFQVTAEGTFTRLIGSLYGQPPNQSGLYFEMTPADGTGANVWVQTPTVVITDLTPGQTYTLSVKARNYLGQNETPSVGPVVQGTTAALLDIKPGSCPNPLNLRSRGYLPVAVMGTGNFDVTEIDISSVRMSRADGVGGAVAPNEGPPGPHSVLTDVATPYVGEWCDCTEATGDGAVDLSMKFKRQELVEALELDGEDAGTAVELIVTGFLLDGTAFTTLSDCVGILAPPHFGQDDDRATRSAGRPSSR